MIFFVLIVTDTYEERVSSFNARKQQQYAAKQLGREQSRQPLQTKAHEPSEANRE